MLQRLTAVVAESVLPSGVCAGIPTRFSKTELAFLPDLMVAQRSFYLLYLMRWSVGSACESVEADVRSCGFKRSTTCNPPKLPTDGAPRMVRPQDNDDASWGAAGILAYHKADCQLSLPSWTFRQRFLSIAGDLLGVAVKEICCTRLYNDIRTERDRFGAVTL